LLKHSGANIIQRAKVSHILQTGKTAEDKSRPLPYGNTQDKYSVSGVRVDGYDLMADAVIVAADHMDTAEILSEINVIDKSSVEQIEYSPIVNIHFVFAEKVMPFEIAAAVRSSAQFIFDTTASSGLAKDKGQSLTISVSAAHEEVGAAPKVLIDKYLAELALLFPKVREVKLADAVVSREVKATMKATPGTKRLRPNTDTGYSNLFLAGAWTNTGWPITMESAVLSGLKASKSTLQHLGFSKSSEQIGEGVLN